MFSLLKKELQSFLGSITGYVVIIVYLLVNGLFLWVLSTNFNILDYGFAGLDNYFMLAPWVFMFLIPAITMRSFSDENKVGTMETLLTKPISEWQIITAKYLASIVLILFSIVPTLIYYFSVYQLGNPVGNLDVGGTWGAFIGLFFLGSSFAAIGIFCSSFSLNQIVSFVMAVLLCGLLYIGSDFIASFKVFGSAAYYIEQLGINAHYTGMSKGVVDTRDLIYFISLITLFLLLTKFILERRKW